MEEVGGHGREVGDVWEVRGEEEDPEEARGARGRPFYRYSLGAPWATPMDVPGELMERGGGPGRIRPTVLQVVDVEGTSGDTLALPKAAWKPREGRATVPRCTVACSRARLWPACSCLCFPGRVPQCPVVLGSSKQWGGSLGCSVEPLK